MTFDQWLGVWGIAIGFVGLIVTIVIGVWAVRDGRRLRNERERAVITAYAVIERTYGLLIGIKPSHATLGKAHEQAVEDGLLAIDEQRHSLNNL